MTPSKFGAPRWDAAIVVGVACGPARDEDVPPATGEMQAIYLLPEYRSRGVGRALWLATMFADNARAIVFYRAAGFENNPACEEFDEYAGARLKAVRYKMRLA